jgi:hypothetical protein
MLKTSKRYLVILITVLGALALEAAAWLLESNADFHESSRGLPFSTSSWFILGQVFIFPIAAIYGKALGILYEKKWCKTAWIALLVTSSSLILSAYCFARPQARFQNIVGADVAARTQLVELVGHDSFGDGEFFFGKFRAPENIFEALSQFRSLRRIEEPPTWMVIHFGVNHSPRDNSPLLLTNMVHSSGIQKISWFISNTEPGYPTKKLQ